MTKVIRPEATLRLYHALNSPVTAGKTWVKYERKTIEAALDVLKQLLELEGFNIKKEEQND